MSVFLEHLHSEIHKSWNSFLSSEIRNELLKIESELYQEDKLTPSPDRILHFMTRDLASAKVLILGQDPYPQKDVATGRAFEVGTLKSWHNTFRNTSLKNIVRSLYYAETGQYLTFNQIKSKLNSERLFESKFELLNPDVLFEYWEDQGVLLLNTSFTCELGKPASHAKLWFAFTKKLLSYINQQNRQLIWFLWGNHAKEISSHLDLTNSYVSNHPMICKEGENDFLFGIQKPFSKTLELIDWTGKRKPLKK